MRLVKKIISIFFLFIISIQCLPVKEIRKSLFDSTITEEELCGKSMDKKQSPDNSKEFCLEQIIFPANTQNNKSRLFNASADLFSTPSADVTTPPPNA